MVRFAGILTTPPPQFAEGCNETIGVSPAFIFKELVVASVLTPEADHYDSYLLVGT